MPRDEVKIRLPEELVDYLQAMEYELGGLRVLHTHALNAGAPEERVLEIRERFQEKFAECQLAKEELWAKFGGNFPGRRWRVDFLEGVLRVEPEQQA